MVKYERVARDLQDKIASGKYRPNERLPIIPDLCEEYGVSKITIKRAMDILVTRGLVVKRRGSGTFVKNIEFEQDVQPLQDMSRTLAGFTGGYEDTGIEVTTLVQEFEVIEAGDEAAEHIRIDPHSFVYHIVRTRLADDVPQEIQYVRIPIATLPGLTIRDARGSIYSYVRQALGSRPYSAHRSIRAVMPTPKETEHLQIDKDDPLLEVNQTVYLENGQLLEWSICRHVGSRYTYYDINND